MTGLLIRTIIILAIVCILALCINKVEDENNTKRGIAPIPFKESMDLLSVPIVTFTSNNVKLHFLLDTGSDASYIRKEIIDALVLKDRNNTGATINTAGGTAESEGTVTLDIFYRNQKFEETFEVADVTSMWDEATTGTNIIIHGILGSKFLNKYEYLIDFEELAAYSKKGV